MTIRKKKRICHVITRTAFAALVINACLIDAGMTYLWRALICAAAMTAGAWKGGELQL